jgi:glucosylceramidase
MGFHWYETWAGGEPMFDNVRKGHEAYPFKKNYYLLKVVSKKFDAKKYQFGQTENRYGTSMINDFNNGTVGWTDWNILLDQNGGPNHVGNFVCTYSCRYHSRELIYTPSYYYIGHFKIHSTRCCKRVSTAVTANLISTPILE